MKSWFYSRVSLKNACFFWRSQWCLTDLHPHTFLHKLINYEIRLLLGPKSAAATPPATRCACDESWVPHVPPKLSKIHPSTLNSSLSLVVSLLVDAFFSGTQVFQRWKNHQHTHPPTVLGTEFFVYFPSFQKKKRWNLPGGPTQKQKAQQLSSWNILESFSNASFVSGKKMIQTWVSTNVKEPYGSRIFQKKKLPFPAGAWLNCFICFSRNSVSTLCARANLGRFFSQLGQLGLRNMPYRGRGIWSVNFWVNMGVSLNGGTPQNTTPKCWSFLVGKTPWVCWVSTHHFRSCPQIYTFWVSLTWFGFDTWKLNHGGFFPLDIS